ncbi:hypothetical protein Tco_0169200, partial [Tanacetum coccineum]
IYQGIPEDLLLSLVEKKTAKDAWETLKTMFIGEDRVKTAKVQTLKADFETLNMKDMEITDDFAMKVNNIISNIQALGEKVEEAYVVNKQHYLDNMTVEEVIGRDLRRTVMKNKRPHNATLDQVHLIIEVEEEAGEEVIILIVVDVVLVVPIKTEKEDEDLQVTTTKSRFNVTIAETLDTMPTSAKIHEKRGIKGLT